MHSGIAKTFEVIYNSGFMVEPIPDEALEPKEGDKNYPNSHPLINQSGHSPLEAHQDLEQLRLIGIVELETIGDKEMYVLTNSGIQLAHDREMKNRQLELEKRREKRQLEMNKGLGLISFSLVYVTLVNLIIRYNEELGIPSWFPQLFFISSIIIVILSFISFVNYYSNINIIGDVNT